MTLARIGPAAAHPGEGFLSEGRRLTEALCLPLIYPILPLPRRSRAILYLTALVVTDLFFVLSVLPVLCLVLFTDQPFAILRSRHSAAGAFGSPNQHHNASWGGDLETASSLAGRL